jgi:hypothetical protein
MKNLILGNGINIQFGGLDYTNRSIIDRALSKLDLKDFNPDVYTMDVGDWINALYQILPDILYGNYDLYAVLGDEKEELEKFKVRYTTSTAINEVGFEDFFLMNELFCRKNKISNPERFYAQEFIRRLFLDSIYNNGKINIIHQKFPHKFKKFLNEFDIIFTTNYDKNIELSAGREVLYLHGAFHVLAAEYDPNSFRNQLSDRPVEKTPVVKGYEHVFSTALTGSSGTFKKFSSDSQENANSAITKFAEGYLNRPDMRPQIDEWKDSDDASLRNMYEGIKLKISNPNLKLSIDYALSRLKSIVGDVIIMGLSPYNDTHIFSLLRENEQIQSIEYYYYEKTEVVEIALRLEDKLLIAKNVTEFWEAITKT